MEQWTINGAQAASVRYVGSCLAKDNYGWQDTRCLELKWPNMFTSADIQYPFSFLLNQSLQYLSQKGFAHRAWLLPCLNYLEGASHLDLTRKLYSPDLAPIVRIQTTNDCYIINGVDVIDEYLTCDIIIQARYFGYGREPRTMAFAALPIKAIT